MGEPYSSAIVGRCPKTPAPEWYRTRSYKRSTLHLSLLTRTLLKHSILSLSLDIITTISTNYTKTVHMYHSKTFKINISETRSNATIIKFDISQGLLNLRMRESDRARRRLWSHCVRQGRRIRHSCCVLSIVSSVIELLSTKIIILLLNNLAAN